MTHRPFLSCLGIGLVLLGATPAPLLAQDAPPPGADPNAGDPNAPVPQDQLYSPEQLDALLAPVALYPDALLTQTLMASAYPLQVVEAARWVQDPANSGLSGDALVGALADKPWDPSVKSLVPFPRVLAMLNDKLDWMQQVGWAMGAQQPDVMASVQRLRSQAQAAGTLQSSDQQLVSTQDQAIVIAPAQPNVVYVPVYDPSVVYGAWPYPAYPPVYLPPPPGYAVGVAIAAGFAFGAAVAINGGLWGWAQPRWGYGHVQVNVQTYNHININRPPINSPNWRPGGPGYRAPGGYRPPASGPVGAPKGGGAGGAAGWSSRSGAGGGGRPPNLGGQGSGNKAGGAAGWSARPGAGGGGRPPNPGGSGLPDKSGGVSGWSARPTSGGLPSGQGGVGTGGRSNGTAAGWSARPGSGGGQPAGAGNAPGGGAGGLPKGQGVKPPPRKRPPPPPPAG